MHGVQGPGPSQGRRTPECDCRFPARLGETAVAGCGDGEYTLVRNDRTGEKLSQGGGLRIGRRCGTCPGKAERGLLQLPFSPQKPFAGKGCNKQQKKRLIVIQGI